MLGKPGPFQVIKSEEAGVPGSPTQPPRRRYECPNYQTCLSIAAAVNWDSFTCRGCNGQVEESLFWQAHNAQRHDKVAEQICEIPPIRYHCCGDGTTPPIKIVGR
ncbi:MAG: hypothetical protein QY326_05775 [Bdellovibrionota bacterium]|nr:MAG: hypothetical protein QY326_05775 [Bdellovibrionota bacterium]